MYPLLDMINISLITKMKVINEKIDDDTNGCRPVEWVERSKLGFSDGLGQVLTS